MKKILSAVLLSSVMLLGGCATIMGDKTQVMPVSSSPSDATIKITDERGIEVIREKIKIFASTTNLFNTKHKLYLYIIHTGYRYQVDRVGDQRS